MIFTFSFLTNISPHSTQTAQKREKSSAWRWLCSAQRCLCSDLPLSAGRIFSWGLTLGLQLHLACMRMSMSPHSCQQSKGYVTTGPNNYPLHQSIIEGSAKIKTGYGTTSPSFSPRKGKINTWSRSSLWGRLPYPLQCFTQSLTNFSIKSQIVNILDLRATQNLSCMLFFFFFLQYLKM